MIDQLKEIRSTVDKLIEAAEWSRFVTEECQYVPGAAIEFKVFYERLRVWAAARGSKPPAKMTVVRSIFPPFVSGIRSDGKRHVGNLMFRGDMAAQTDQRLWVLTDGGRLRRQP